MILVAPTDPLPGLGLTLVNCSRNEIGSRGEFTAKVMLERAGYAVEKASRRCGDLRVLKAETGEIWRIEVKTARRCRDRKWRFTLWKKGCTDHRHSDVVILLAVTADGHIVPFVVPVDFLAGQHQAVITSEPRAYAGKLAVYRRPSHTLLLD